MKDKCLVTAGRNQPENAPLVPALNAAPQCMASVVWHVNEGMEPAKDSNDKRLTS